MSLSTYPRKPRSLAQALVLVGCLGGGACAALSTLFFVTGNTGVGRLAVASAGFALSLGLALCLFSSKRYFRRYIGVCSARELGMYRASVALAVLLQTLSEPLASLSDVPSEILRPMGMMRVFRPLFGTEFAHSSGFLMLLQALTCIALTFAAVGYRARVALPLSAFLSLICGGLIREHTHFFHTGLLSMQLLVLLACMPCAEGFALDARGRARSETRDKSRVVTYGYARYMLWLWLGIVYLCTGVSKLRAYDGFGWAAPNNVRRFLFRDFLQIDYLHIDAAEFIFRAPDAFFILLGAATLLIELLYISVLVSRRARKMFPLLALGMHAGILFLQGFTFFDCILVNLAFFLLATVGAFPARTTQQAKALPFYAPLAERFRREFPRCHVGVFALLCFLGPLQLFVWLARVEQYPITQWALYSVPTKASASEFFRVESSSFAGAPLHNVLAQCNPIYHRDSRWRDIAWRAFARPEQYAAWLRTCVHKFDRARPAPLRVREICVKRYVWDFVRFPNAPEQAVAIDTHCTPFTGPPLSIHRHSKREGAR